MKLAVVASVIVATAIVGAILVTGITQNLQASTKVPETESKPSVLEKSPASKEIVAEEKPVPLRITAMLLRCGSGWGNGELGKEICKEGFEQLELPHKFNMSAREHCCTRFDYHYGIEAEGGHKMRLFVNSTSPIDLRVTFTEGAKVQMFWNLNNPMTREILSKKQITSVGEVLSVQRSGLFQFDFLQGDKDLQSGRWPLSNATVTFDFRRLP